MSKTRIFARAQSDGRQFLAYAMSLEAAGELAMVLPIPVPPSSPEDAVVFVDMSSQPKFFATLDRLFPVPMSRGSVEGDSMMLSASVLEVHQVGDFEASFVPSRGDFERLDPRFRLAPDVWDALPMYADWGFCVFKLRVKGEDNKTVEEWQAIRDKHEPPPPKGLLDRVRGLLGIEAEPSGPPPPPATVRDYHPMALSFPRRDDARLFFPTVHVHDGVVHPKAHFDHTLYCQLDADTPQIDPPLIAGLTWETSRNVAGDLGNDMNPWLDASAQIHRLTLSAKLPNRDVLVRRG